MKVLFKKKKKRKNVNVIKDKVAAKNVPDLKEVRDITIKCNI